MRTLKALNPDPQTRLHLDSNGTPLTPDYIDELVLEAGVTDIGVEPKAVQVPTFQRVTGQRQHGTGGTLPGDSLAGRRVRGSNLPRLGLLYLSPYAKELMLRTCSRDATSRFALP